MEYIIRQGDSLSQIAKRHGTTTAQLLRLNPQLDNPNQIKVDETLQLAATNSPARAGCNAGQISQDSQCSGAVFDLAFFWNDKVQSREAIYEEIYGSEMHFLHRSLFQRNNEHLRDTVLPGELVIISSMPRSDADHQRLEKMREQAKLASAGIQQLVPEEAMTVKRHLEVLDYISFASIASHQSTALGVLSAAAGKHLGDIKSILEKLNSAYVEELHKVGNVNRFSPAFYTRRQQLLGQLDHAVGRMTLSTINIRQYSSIKNTLGLSTKSILHNAAEIMEGGQVPQLGQRINTASAWANGSKRLGYLGIAIDGGVRLSRIHDACTGGSVEMCRQVSYKQAGGFSGSASFGALGGYVGAKVAVGIAGGIALALGVTVGAPVLLVVGLVGAGVGAYYGGSEGSDFGERAGTVIYEWAR